MRLPFVKLSEWRRQQDEIADLREQVRNRDRQLSKMGHKIPEMQREYAKLLEDLRIIQVNIEHPYRTGESIKFQFEIAGSIFDGYRRNDKFVDLIAHMVENMMRSTLEGRKALSWMS